jgi:quinol monooxygenase YgiN
MANQQLTVVARFRAKAGQAEAVRQLLAGMIAPIRSEPGNLGTELLRREEDADAFLVYENWRTEGELEAHLHSATFHNLERDLADKLEEPCSVTILRPTDSGAPPSPTGESSLLSAALADLDEHFLEGEGASTHKEGSPETPPETPTAESTAADFRHLAAEAEHEQEERKEEAERSAAHQQEEEVRRMIDLPLTNQRWWAMLDQARKAAGRGQREMMLLRFPNGVCTDGGRAINVPEPDWPRTLRGQPAEIYRRWERQLRDKGFRLSARVVDFPGGYPGDIGLFLSWGK